MQPLQPARRTEHEVYQTLSERDLQQSVPASSLMVLDGLLEQTYIGCLVQQAA